MKAARISVVMPTRNSAETLPAAIESIQRQDYSDFEFIIVDHRSDDTTPAILAEAADADSRIRLYQCEGTFVEAANLAWQKSEGQLIARMDSDDIAKPDRLRHQLNFLDQNPDIAACGSLVRIVRRGPDQKPVAPDGGYQRYESWVNSVTDPEDIAAQRFVDSPIPNPSSMIRRHVLEELGGYHDPVWAEDYDFWLRLLDRGHRLGKVDRTLLDWYDDPGRSTRNIERYELARFQEAKAFFLSSIPQVQARGVVLCGAGPIGKEMLRLLQARGCRVHAFLEVNKRQIGNQIKGVPILSAEALSSSSERPVALAAVGQPGARERIRKLVRAVGYVEGIDFFCVA